MNLVPKVPMRVKEKLLPCQKREKNMIEHHQFQAVKAHPILNNKIQTIFLNQQVQVAILSQKQ